MTWEKVGRIWTLRQQGTQRATVRPNYGGWLWMLTERLEAGTAATEDEAKAAAEAAIAR